MGDKRDLKFDKKAEKYDDGYEGKLSKKFYDLVTEKVVMKNGLNVFDERI